MNFHQFLYLVHVFRLVFIPAPFSVKREDAGAASGSGHPAGIAESGVIQDRQFKRQGFGLCVFGHWIIFLRKWPLPVRESEKEGANEDWLKMCL